MPNKTKFSILILIFVLLCLPRLTSAVFGIGDVGLFDVFENILSGIEEKTAPVLDAVISVFTFYILGVAFLALSSNFLETFISQQGQWMTNLEPMTQGGWDFTVGLSNMLLILIFLAIAFAFILKIESFQAKKALPRLIIVALLINFSWVFVKMLTDLTQIIYNTILPEGSLFSTALSTFFGSATSLITNIIAWVAVIGGSLAIPIANSFTQVLISILTTVIILPNIIIWCVQAFFFYALALMFLSFAFLFAARVFVIQILAILSPLAFLCLILPQTKSFWSQWYKTLIEWLLLGIFFLFFLRLGFDVVGLLAPTGWEAVMIPGFSMFNFGGQVIYYFAVFIYMAVILFIGKKFIPQGAKELIDFTKGIASTVLTRGLVPLGGAMKKNIDNFATAQGGRESEIKGSEESGEKIKLAPLNRVAMEAGRWMRKGVELGHRIAGTTLNEENSKEIAKGEAEANKINDPSLLLSRIKDAKRSGNKNRELGLIAAGISKGKGWKKLIQEDKSIDKSKTEMISLGAQANAVGATKQAETLARGFMHKGLTEGNLSAMGFKLSDTDKERYGSIKEMLWAKSKGDDLKQFKTGSWLNEEGKMEDFILKDFDGARLGTMAIEHGDAWIDDYNEGIEAKEKEHPGWLMENNNRSVNYLKNTSAQELGYDANVLKAPREGWEAPSSWTKNNPRWKQGNPPLKWTPTQKIPKGWVYTPTKKQKGPKQPEGPIKFSSAEREKGLEEMMRTGQQRGLDKNRQAETEKQKRVRNLEEMIKTGTQKDLNKAEKTEIERQTGERVMRNLEGSRQEKIQRRNEEQKTIKEETDLKAKQMNEELEALRKGEEPPTSGAVPTPQRPNPPRSGPIAAAKKVEKDIKKSEEETRKRNEEIIQEEKKKTEEQLFARRKERDAEIETKQKEEQAETERTQAQAREYPTWFKAGMKIIEKGGVPSMVPTRLENFLHSNGLTRSTIDKLKPKDAWLKAKEIFDKQKNG